MGQSPILNQDGTVNSSTKPARVGSYISIYGTGFGALNSPSADTDLPTIQSGIGAMRATWMLWSGAGGLH
jgi:uncharacterized protein (TIGR03437 family)